MRYIIVGLGAIGGPLAAMLHESGTEVIGVARGPHLAAIRRNGLLVRRPGESLRVPLATVSGLDEIAWRDDDVVVLAVKSHDTLPILQQLALTAPSTIAIACAQNGVSNEIEGLRWFGDVLGVLVQCPTLHLDPGVVTVYTSPTVGILDIGRFPAGGSPTAQKIASDWSAAGYSSQAVNDIARWKYAKLLTNLGNAVEVVCGPESAAERLVARLQAEARTVFDRHGIEYASQAEDRARRADHLSLQHVDGPRPGGSTWQSATRGQPTEIDYLCGEVVRLARLVGLAAPANQLMQALTHRITSGSLDIGSMTESDVLEQLDHPPGR